MPSDNSHRNSGTTNTFTAPVCIPRVEEDADVSDQEERPSDQPEPGHAARYETGAVHQVAEDQPVPEGDDEAGAEQERPVLERREGNGEIGRAGESWRKVTTPSTKMIPAAMKTDSMIRAATYPTARSSFCLLTIG